VCGWPGHWAVRKRQSYIMLYPPWATLTQSYQADPRLVEIFRYPLQDNSIPEAERPGSLTKGSCHSLTCLTNFFSPIRVLAEECSLWEQVILLRGSTIISEDRSLSSVGAPSFLRTGHSSQGEHHHFWGQVTLLKGSTIIFEDRSLSLEGASSFLRPSSTFQLEAQLSFLCLWWSVALNVIN